MGQASWSNLSPLPVQLGMNVLLQVWRAAKLSFYDPQKKNNNNSHWMTCHAGSLTLPVRLCSCDSGITITKMWLPASIPRRPLAPLSSLPSGKKKNKSVLSCSIVQSESFGLVYYLLVLIARGAFPWISSGRGPATDVLLHMITTAHCLAGWPGLTLWWSWQPDSS